MHTLPIVECCDAFLWTCEKCWTTNYERITVISRGVYEEDLLIGPSVVCCENCRTKYRREKVHTEECFLWTCDNCGIDQFVEREKQFKFVPMPPEQVRCADCKYLYSTQY